MNRDIDATIILYFHFESFHVMSHKSHWSMIDLLQNVLNCDMNDHPFNINLPYRIDAQYLPILSSLKSCATKIFPFLLLDHPKCAACPRLVFPDLPSHTLRY